MQNTRHDLSVSVRTSVCEKLQFYVALLIDLKLQAKQAHWNVKGANFYSLHELFDKVASEADDHADEVAERTVQLGGVINGLAKAVSAKSTLPEFPESGDSTQFTTALANSLASAAKTIRNAADEIDEMGDTGSADMLTGISRGLDKALWMVEAHLYSK